MTAASVSILHPPAISKQFAARSVLPTSLHYLWRIETGFVRTTTWAEDGTVLVLGIWGAGDWVGRSLSTVNPYQIESLTRIEASALPQESLTDLTPILITHLNCTEQLMLIRGSKRVDVMLLKLLSWLASRFGQPIQQGHLIDLRLTHQDLAELLGTTRVTVTRTLSQLEQQGYIERLPLQRIVLQKDEVWHYEI